MSAVIWGVWVVLCVMMRMVLWAVRVVLRMCGYTVVRSSCIGVQVFLRKGALK